jgi:hypothetical protein
MRKIWLALMCAVLLGVLWLGWLGHAISDAAAIGKFHALRDAVPPGTSRAAVEGELAARHLRWNYFLDGRAYEARSDVPAAYPHPAITVILPAGSTIVCSYERLGTITFDGADKVADVADPKTQSMCM